MSPCRRMAICCIIVLLPLRGNAQTTPSLWFHSLGAKQGLAQSFNWYVYHDSQGFVWVSSTAGLNRFDGLHAEQYHSVQADASSLLDDNVYSEFFEDNKNNLWFSTIGAVHCYVRKHDRFQRHFIFNRQNQPVPGPYKVQYLEQDSFLWVTANNTLYRMNINQPKAKADSVAATEQFKCRMEVGANGAVQRVYAFGMIAGIEIFQIKQSQINGNPQVSSDRRIILPKEFVREVWAEHPNRIWISSNTKGLFSVNPNIAEPKPDAPFFPGMAVAFVPWQKNQIIMAVRGKGIFSLNTDKKSLQEWDTRFVGQDATALQTIKGIYCDRDNNLWLTDESTGLYFANLYKAKFSSLPKPESPKINGKYLFWSIQEDQDDNIWIGTSPGGVFRLNPQGKLVEHFVHEPKNPRSLPSNWVRAIVIDKENNIYVGTSLGLARFEPSDRSFEVIAVESGKKELLINHLMLTSTGRIFATTEKDGIYEVVRRNTGATLVEMLPASTGAFQTIFEGPNQNLYCAKNLQQVDVYSLGNGPFQLLDSLPITGLVNGYFGYKEKSLEFFGTSNGLARLSRERPTTAPFYFTETDGLPGKNIVGMLADSEHNLWLGTNNGLASYHEPTGSIRAFSMADGVPSAEFHLTAALKRRNGELWFGGSEGITIVEKNGQFTEIGTLPKTVIKRIEINDKEPDSLYCHQTGATNHSQIEHLVLPYSQNTISFEFAALEYSDPENVRVRFRLEGQDNDWVEIRKGKPLYARYPNLGYNHYSFWLQACNSDGKWGQPKKVISVTIKPPWYHTWWFRIVLGSTVVALLYYYYRSRIAQIRKEAAFKQMAAEFSQKEAEHKQLMAETETAILRLQMNPHFIFNSMNSINAYIHKKDIDTASGYLTRFATLMRMILSLAAKPYIPIADEIDFLEQYLNTEAMRFERKFSFFLEVDPSIDPDDMIVPTMILQPFVENAIWHGLVKKEGAGSIKISFALHDDALIATVEDNGIGRAAAKLLKDGNLTHESQALSITARRLKLLEEELHVPSGYEIIDLVSPDGTALGTRVVVRLPLL